MAIYLVTGKLGSGKSLACVGRIRDALAAGRRVVTNLDLNLERMLPRSIKAVSCVRIPDKPTLADLEAIGVGNDERDESRNGLIVLDELGAWLNTRTYADKDRSGVIDWLLHSRKFGWDVYMIIQHAAMVDKQVREGLAEFLVTCRRTDRLRVPLVSSLSKAIAGVDVRPPQIHVGTVRYGLDPNALVVDRWWYRARELYGAYDTRQVFTGERTGPYSMLGPCYLPEPSKPAARGLIGALCRWARPDAQRRAAPKPKRPEVALLMQLEAEHRMRVWHRGGLGALPG